MTMLKEFIYKMRVVLLLAIILSLCVAFLDITISLLLMPADHSAKLFLLPPMVATMSFFLLGFGIVCLLVIRLQLISKDQVVPLAVSAALFIVTLFTTASLNNLIRFPLSVADLFKLILLVVFSSLLAVGAYYSTHVIFQANNTKKTVVALCLAIPFVLAEVMIFVWLYPTLNVFVFGLVVVFTFGLFFLLRQKVHILTKLLGGFMVFVLISPLFPVILKKYAQVSYIAPQNKDHPITRVILITVDTLRPDFLTCYNALSRPTPNIDQLAGDGILFTNAISSAPWTLPAFASIFTGVAPNIHSAKDPQASLPEEMKTLAEYLRDAGYLTAGMGRNNFLLPVRNLSQGFFEYNFFPKTELISNTSFGTKLLQRICPGFNQPDVTTADLTGIATEWLKANYQKDFFLWLHYFDPHQPYEPPQKFLAKTEPSKTIGARFAKMQEIRGGYFVPSLKEREWIKSLYESEVLYIDENIGKFIDTLKQLNIYDESLVVFTSDHGEEFWEHGGYEHGHTLYNELLRIPLIVKLPSSTAKGQVSAYVSTQSITPTILDLCAIEYNRAYPMNAALTPLLTANSNAYNNQPIVSTSVVYYEDRESVIFDGFKYIRSLVTSREELYNLNHDPGEQNSLLTMLPQTLKKAKKILTTVKARESELIKVFSTTNNKVKLDKDTLKQLKSLGYLK